MKIRKGIKKPKDPDSVEITCPACWQRLTIVVDRSAGSSQCFVYDCEVCCRPLRISIRIDEQIAADVEAE